MRHAVILAGGSGTRLWPASRRDRPKQFLALGARPGETLLEATERRVRLIPELSGQPPVIVTAAAQAALLGDSATRIVLREPQGRNTATALGLAAVHLIDRDPAAILGVFPADHSIADDDGFAAAAARAFALVEASDVIATIGITPTHAETGYGYLEPGPPIDDQASLVRRFVEKPDAQTAEQYLAAGYLWNAGMFFVSARRLLDELARHMPQTHAGLMEIAGAADREAATARVYPGLPSQSIDFGVMEKTERVVAVRGTFGWSDVGSFAALADYRPHDDAGNVVDGTAVFHDAHGNIVLGEPGMAIAVIGVDDLVVVQAGDGIVVVPRARAQEVRHAVIELQRRGLGRFL
ncbi:MAG TPA: sugar phosphate nucleotidyltransferase [Kofleriaceae bacterium]|nr:sugar phosphate nucleotidyltransferase [Kofleriaceae bacterium]